MNLHQKEYDDAMDDFHGSKIVLFIKDLCKVISLVWKTNPSYTSLTAMLTIITGLVPAMHLWVSKLLLNTVSSVLQGGVKDPFESFSHLLVLIGVQAGLFFFSNFISNKQNMVRELLGEQLRIQISVQVLEKTSGLELTFFEDEKFYNRLQNAYQEAGQRPLEIVTQLFYMCQSAIILSSMAVILVQLHWLTLAFILITTLPALWVQNRYGLQNYWVLRERAPELRKQYYFGMLLTSDWFIKDVRVFQLEKYLLTLYTTLFDKFFRQTQKLVIKRSNEYVIASGISVLGWLLTSVYIIIKVGESALTIGDFALYTQAISTVQGGIQSFFSQMSSLYSHTMFLRNLFEYLSIPARDLSAGKRWSEPIECIEFRNVSFIYPGSGRHALHNVSFKIQQGKSLALVGKNGAGKTTIVKLLCRLYEPSSGEILLNGMRVADFSPQSIQEQVAVLFQDYGNYYLSARENIGIGNIGNIADQDGIQSAAQKSGADRFIEKLPQTYETTLGKWFDEGCQLSGGEWQKIGLARIFFRNSPIVILDEPTASLDAEAEHEIFEKLVKNNANQIKMLISHRFSTIRMADQILVLENGKIIEEGSHEELMRMAGQYEYLFKLQARGYEESNLH